MFVIKHENLKEIINMGMLQGPVIFVISLRQHRVFHKSVKHFKNSQQINYSTDHGSSYADRERNTPSFFTYFTDAQFVHLW